MTDLVALLSALAKAKVVCPRCEAPVNKGCVTISGKTLSGTHVSRWEPLLEAYNLGIKDASRV